MSRCAPAFCLVGERVMMVAGQLQRCVSVCKCACV